MTVAKLLRSKGGGMLHLSELGSKWTVHGISDFQSANPIGKIFWALCLVGFTVVGCIQGASLIASFLNQEVGTTMLTEDQSKMPHIVICPLEWLDIQNGRGDFPRRGVPYINGYFPHFATDYLIKLVATTYEGNYPAFYSREKRWATEALRKYNYSLEAFLKDHAFYDSSWTEILIPGEDYLQWEFQVNWHGPCERHFTNSTVSSLQGQFAGIAMQITSSRVNTTAYDDDLEPVILPEAPKGPNHFLLSLTSDADPNPLLFRSSERLLYGFEYQVQASVYQMSRKNRRNARCQAGWSMSDTLACGARHGNQICMKENDKGCVTYIPSTPHFPEVTGDNLCNVHDEILDYEQLCLVKALNKQLTTEEWNEECPKPCEEEIFEFTYQRNKRIRDAEGQTSWIYLHIAGKGGIRVKEYFTMTGPGLLSGIGGTMGLWLGASFMSFVQAGYLLCCYRICQKKSHTVDLQV